jgi:hypothetical protein
LKTIRKFSYNPSLQEGINDKNLFKSVFLAGGAGSGKSFIASKVFGYGQDKVAISPMGAKIVNSDKFFEIFLAKEGLPSIINMDNQGIYTKQMTQRELAKKKTDLQKKHYINGMLPLIIDGTGRDLRKILGIKEELEKVGYDTRRKTGGKYLSDLLV